MADVTIASGAAGIDAPVRVRPRLSQDEALQRGLLGWVILYLVCALLIPLGMVGMKAFQTFSFRLDQVEVEFQRDGRWGERATLADWAARSNYIVNGGLRASERTRELPSKIISRGDRRGVSAMRLRDLSASSNLLMVDSAAVRSGDWWEVPASAFGQVQIRPAMAYGIDNFRHYFGTPSLRQSILNSVGIALLVSAIVTPIAFIFAYGLTRTNMRGKGTFRLIASVPVLIPSLLPAIGLIYLFGKQGVLTPLLFGASIYGPLGIVLASIFFTLPHALVIMIVALGAADQRLYEAAEVLRASPWRIFRTVTLPGARYGLISATFVVFTLVVTDFGVPKVVGGDFQMLALDIYKQVIGQQNFQMGAVVSMILLVPAVFAFALDRVVSRKQVALLTARAVPYEPKLDPARDRAFFAACAMISVFILAVLATCQIAAIAKFWPYDLTPSLRHFDFNRMDGGGWKSYWNSLQLAVLVATIGAVLIFLGAYLMEKTRGFEVGRLITHLLAMVPMAVPGMVLGLAYIFFFNNPSNPLHVIYGTMAILVVCTVSHLYTVPHLTASTALKQMDGEFESVSMSLKQPFWRTLGRVSAPVCFPSIAEIWIYLFVNAMTTVSAVVFLYSPSTTLASIAVLNMDDAGDIAPAAAMGMMIFYTNVAVRVAHTWLVGMMVERGQKWRKR
ncbi:putative 2-aminoethylphosphonate ABC transporter permease subunit [Bradyrhizobium prioriisuperbiae]|uniref:putative 2-aminoethylphosphonate ABC transporter permease subunit n=1 Tax=Bradyrhizobium prioriisuperbiae TaxID=2854389 RepID=UPI0028ED0A2D|nr:putative 2-aminoethylphosphonate ABC transporter permease subunit [Bradyrhizobium prioritasuperba]